MKSAAGATGGPRPSTSAPGLATSPGVPRAVSVPGATSAAPPAASAIAFATAASSPGAAATAGGSLSRKVGGSSRGSLVFLGKWRSRERSFEYLWSTGSATYWASTFEPRSAAQSCFGRVACRIWRVVDVGHDACFSYMAACNTSRVLVCATRLRVLARAARCMHRSVGGAPLFDHAEVLLDPQPRLCLRLLGLFFLPLHP